MATETIERTDSMATAGKKILRAQLAALQEQEAGARAGEDPEAIHDMRVADRRIRAVLRLLEAYVEESAVQQILQDIKSLHRALGAARDLDVLMENARAFRDTLPAEQQEDLDGLLDDWAKDRKRSGKRLRRALDDDKYRDFQKDLQSFLEEDETLPDQQAGAVPYQVRHLAGSAIWSRYEAVRAYETIVDTASLAQLHALRITGKYLRYTLEFFRDVLAKDAGALIRDVVRLQDQLGALHDADVSAGLIRDYLDKADEDEAPPGLAAYLRDREAAVARLCIDFRPAWETVRSPEWRQRLAAAVAAL